MSKNTTNKQETISILLIFSLAFILRAVFLFITVTHNSYMSSDSYDYFNLAKGLYLNHIYGNIQQAEILRVPGYPFLIFINMFIFKTLAIKATLVSQVILDSLSAIFVLKITTILFHNLRLSMFAGLLYAVSPLCIIYSCKLLSETLFVFFLLLLIFSLLSLVANLKNNRKSYYLCFLWIAILCAVASLVRDIFTPVSILIFIYLALRNKKLAKPLFSFIVFIVILGSWALRNYQETGYPGISTISSINFYRYSACSVLAKVNNLSFQNEQAKIDSQLKILPTQTEVSKYCIDKGLAVLKTHPFLFIYLQLKNSLNSLLPSLGDLVSTFGVKIGGNDTLSIINSSGIIAGIKNYFNGNYLLLLMISPFVLLLIICYVLAILGFFLAATRANYICKLDHILFLLLILFFTFAGGAASTPRFRICIEPFLCIYTSYGLMFLFRKKYIPRYL